MTYHQIHMPYECNRDPIIDAAIKQVSVYKWQEIRGTKIELITWFEQRRNDGFQGIHLDACSCSQPVIVKC